MGSVATVTISPPAPLTLRDVTIAYDRRPAVHHLDGCFTPGSLTAITGPNGAGKSTLLKALMGDLPVSGGGIDLGGIARRDIGWLPQAAEIDRSFPITVADTVLIGAWAEIGGFRRATAAIGRRVAEALAAVGLDGFGARVIGSLSAGQFQRVLFARLLMQDARVLLLDEPFTAMDARTTRDLLDLVRRWHDEGRTVVAVLHDFEQVRAHFPETLLIAREPIAWGPTAVALSPENLLKARAMAERWDEEAVACDRRERTA